MATFWSVKRLLALNLGERITKVGDKEVKIPIEVQFTDNILRTKDEATIALLRAHPRFKKSFHETDESVDRNALLQNKQLVEKGTKNVLAEASQGIKPKQDRKPRGEAGPF